MIKLVNVRNKKPVLNPVVTVPTFKLVNVRHRQTILNTVVTVPTFMVVNVRYIFRKIHILFCITKTTPILTKKFSETDVNKML